MFGKLYNAMAVVSVATLLAGGGVLGFLVGTGKLNAARAEAIGAVLRGELSMDLLKTDEPTTQPTTSAPAAPRARTEEELAAARERELLESLRLERAVRDLEAQKRLVDSAVQEVIVGQEQLAKQKKEFGEQRKQLSTADQEEGFKKEVEYVSGLSPKLAKEYFVRTWNKQPADAVRLFAALEVGKGKRILEQLKTPAELDLMRDLLEQVRTLGADGNAESGTTPGAAKP